MSQTRHDRALIRTFGVSFLSPQSLVYPVHGWDHLIYATTGAITVTTGTDSWVLPAHRALWVPDGIEHAIHVTTAASLRSLYFRAGRARALPRCCCTVNVPPLLRELILACVREGALSAHKPAHRRLAAVLFDQLRLLPSVPLQLPQPRDPRARRLTEALRESPNCSLVQAARRTGASLRTLERLFRTEAGMSLGAWRRRLQLQQSLERLAAGAAVGEAAAACGYSSVSAYVSRFRRELGITPGKYFASEDPFL